MNPFAALSTLKAVGLVALIAVFLAGLSSVYVGIKAYAAGREREKLIQQAIIAKMVETSRKDLDDANERTRATEESWKLERQAAERKLELERSSTRRALDALRSDHDRMRDELAAAARGGVEESGDSLGACRERASTLGRLLGETLRDGETCAGDAEDLAASVRALRDAWPVTAPAGSSSAVLPTPALE